MNYLVQILSAEKLRRSVILNFVHYSQRYYDINETYETYWEQVRKNNFPNKLSSRIEARLLGQGIYYSLLSWFEEDLSRLISSSFEDLVFEQKFCGSELSFSNKQSGNNKTMYSENKDKLYLVNQTKRFKVLAEISPDTAIYYEAWDSKQLTLEQALSQTVTKLTEHCYELLQSIPADFLVMFGQHIDYVNYINKESSYPLLEKAEFLTGYLQCISNIVVYKELKTPFLVIQKKQTNDKFNQMGWG